MSEIPYINANNSHDMYLTPFLALPLGSLLVIVLGAAIVAILGFVVYWAVQKWFPNTTLSKYTKIKNGQESIASKIIVGHIDRHDPNQRTEASVLYKKAIESGPIYDLVNDWFAQKSNIDKLTDEFRDGRYRIDDLVSESEWEKYVKVFSKILKLIIQSFYNLDIDNLNMKQINEVVSKSVNSLIFYDALDKLNKNLNVYIGSKEHYEGLHPKALAELWDVLDCVASLRNETELIKRTKQH